MKIAKTKRQKRAIRKSLQSIQTTIQTEFHKLYKFLNKRLFDNILPDCQIVFYPFVDKYGEVHLKNCTDGKSIYPIIVLNPVYFQSGLHYMAEIMIHEMVHIYCDLKKIVDINYNTGYHLKQFKESCNMVHLNCVRNSYGFSETTLSNKLTDLIDMFSQKSPLVVLLKKYIYTI